MTDRFPACRHGLTGECMKCNSEVQNAITALQERVAELERDGPIMLPGLCRTKTDGTPVPTTMREALNDYRAAAAAEAKEGDKLRARVAELGADISARSDLMQGYLDCWRNEKSHAERAEAERDAALALLKEARQWCVYNTDGDLVRRIDALLDRGGK